MTGDVIEEGLFPKMFRDLKTMMFWEFQDIIWPEEETDLEPVGAVYKHFSGLRCIVTAEELSHKERYEW